MASKAHLQVNPLRKYIQDQQQEALTPSLDEAVAVPATRKSATDPHSMNQLHPVRVVLLHVLFNGFWKAIARFR